MSGPRTMTEQKWLKYTRPGPMLEFLLCNGSLRKVRLFGIACCQRIRHLLTEKRSLQAMAFAEQHAETGWWGQEDRPEIWAGARAVADEIRMASVASVVSGVTTGHSIPHQASFAVSLLLEFPNELGAAIVPTHVTTALVEFTLLTSQGKEKVSDDRARISFQRNEDSIHARIVRDIFGNPFRPVAFNPAWRTENVLAVAKSIYDERRFSEMPILGDALEDAGCTSQEMLDHCRNPGEHTRGCWVVDLALEKE